MKIAKMFARIPKLVCFIIRDNKKIYACKDFCCFIFYIILTESSFQLYKTFDLIDYVFSLES